MSLFPVTEYDKQFYETRLQGFLPQKLFDIHCHIYKKEFRAPKIVNPNSRVVAWPELVAAENPIEDLEETYRLMFPDKQVSSLTFASCSYRDDIDANNAYVRDAAASRDTLYGLYYSRPTQSGQEVEQAVRAGGFLGLKSYLDLAPSYLPGNEIRIFDFFPHHLLEVADQHGWIVMLHIPRAGRLKDPVNLAQIREIKHRYPRIRLIIAHVGRAYCPEDVGNAFEVLSDCGDLLFDFCANCCEPVFEQLLRAVGPDRILFGSDMPILRMRTHRICENGTYINLVPPGLYGDPSQDPHLREVSAEEGRRITFFMYEEIDAMRRACEACGLTGSDVEKLFYGNARTLIDQVCAGLEKERSVQA